MATPPNPVSTLPGMAQEGAQPAQPQQAQVDPTSLPQELWYELWTLLMDMERQDEIPRRYEVKEILKRRLFFRGEQYWWYNNDTFMWMPPGQTPIGDANYEHPDFQHVTNIFQPYALSLCSVISQNNVAARFWPEKASNPQDVQTAKQADKIVDKIHRDNDWQNKIDETTYYMCTDGFLGSYTRHVTDGERFGLDAKDVYTAEQVPVGNPQVACADCGYSAEGTTETQPTCPDCGKPMADVPQETATVPKYAGTVQIPKGQTVVTMVPALQLKRTCWADNQDEFLYLSWVTDIHKCKVVEAYPDKADEINTSSGGDADSGTASSYERIARRVLYLGTGRHTGAVLKDVGTFRRAWIRPAAFYAIMGHTANETTPCKRCQLLNLFPKGVKVVFFDNVYCESSNESMDEYWETMHTMPGEGQLRETLVSAILPIQEQLNDCINLLFEICMYGVPEGFADMDALDFEARNAQGASAGNITPTKSLGSVSIRDKIMFTNAVEPSQAMMAYINLLFSQIPQFITGAFPALFGGNTGSNDTAAGISIVRNQALGRIGRAWRRLQLFLANTDGKGVHCFAKHATEDTEIPKPNDSGEFESDFIAVEDLQGNVVAYPEVDSQYPTLESDVRQLLMTLFQSGNPLFLQTAATPQNLAYIFRMMGISDMEVSGEDQRNKTNKDIQQLVQEQPQQVEPKPQPQIPGQPPQPPPAPQLIPSVEPDPDVDDLAVAAQTAKTWLISDEGMQAQQQNPAGYANVKAYLKACTQLGKMQQLQQAIASQALMGQGPGNDLAGAEAMQPPQHLAPKDLHPPQKGSPPSTGGGGSNEGASE